MDHRGGGRGHQAGPGVPGACADALLLPLRGLLFWVHARNKLGTHHIHLRTAVLALPHLQFLHLEGGGGAQLAGLMLAAVMASSREAGATALLDAGLPAELAAAASSADQLVASTAAHVVDQIAGHGEGQATRLACAGLLQPLVALYARWAWVGRARRWGGVGGWGGGGRCAGLLQPLVSLICSGIDPPSLAQASPSHDDTPLPHPTHPTHPTHPPTCVDTPAPQAG